MEVQQNGDPGWSWEGRTDRDGYGALGRAQDARHEVDAFTRRYPHGSFVDYEFYDDRYGCTIKVAVTKREQASLRRIERALAKA